MELQLDSVLRHRTSKKAVVALRSLGKTIPEAYEEVLDRVLKENTDLEVLEFLSWIFHAKESLHMEELREALAVELGDTQLIQEHLSEPTFIVEECKGLLSHDEATGLVTFTHYAVQNFLQLGEDRGLLKELHLAKTLLTYLSFDVFRTPCHDDSELKALVVAHKLSRYASRWWPQYVRGEGEREPEIQELIFRLFASADHVRSLLQIEAMRVEFPAGITLLHFAAFHGLTYICGMIVGASDNREMKLPSDVRALLSSHRLGDVHSRDGYGETPLHVAARKGYEEIVRLLVDANSEINAKSGSSADLTPLHLAVIRGHTEVVALLVNDKADLEARGRYWETPLLLAALLGRQDSVDILLKANADVTATTERGETAIMLALISPNAIRVLESLIKAGANLNARDAQGRTALHYTLDLYSFTICKQTLELLLRHGADVNIRSTDSGDTPLHTASCIDLQRRQYEINLQKMEARFSQELVNEVQARRCAVHVTPMPNHEEVQGAEELTEVVKLLLRWNADNNAENFDGDTPLQCAIKVRNLGPAVMLLWEAGGRAEFTMDKLGDQEFLDLLTRELMKKPSEATI